MKARIGYHSLGRGTAIGAAWLYSWVDVMAERARRAGTRFMSGLLTTSLSRRHLQSLSPRLYDAHLHTHRNHGLFEWERAWFRNRLPDRPARILVGAAGAGREAEPLAAFGYSVDAFEPGPRSAGMCERRLGRTGRVFTGSYGDLAAAVLDGEANPLSPLAGEEFDAVLLGWGSLGHLLVPSERARALHAAAALTPTGPVLASFFLASDGTTELDDSKARSAGELVGRVLGGRSAARSLVFVSRYGFMDAVPKLEIDELAKEMGRSAVWEQAAWGYPHVTLSPSQSR